MHLAAWWLHTILVAAFFATIPVNRFLHVITGPLNIAARPERPMGELVPLTMEEVEQTGRTGVHELADFNRQQLLSLDACMECGRCEDACPATATGKPLSPKAVVVDLRRLDVVRRRRCASNNPRRNALGLHHVPGLRAGVPGLDRARRFDQRHAAGSDRRRQTFRAAGESAAADRQPIESLWPSQLPIASPGRKASTCRRSNRIPTSNISSGSAARRHSIRARRKSRARRRSCSSRQE